MADSWLATERQPRDSLAAKIIFFVFVSTFVSSLVVSWVAVHSTFAFLRGQLQQLYPVTLHAAAQALERAEQDLAPRLGQLAREPAIVRAAEGQGAARALALMTERADAHGLLQGLALYDAHGALRAATPGASGEHAAPADGRLALAGGRLVLGVPVRAPDGQVVGRLEALLAPLEQVLDVDDPALAAWLAVVDARGQVLARAHPAPEDAFASFPPALLAEQAAGEAPLRSFRSSDGRRALGAVRPLPVRDWHLVVAQPITKAYAPVLAVLTRIFVIDLAVVLLFSFLAYEITAAIVRPLEQLSEAARRISHGELEVEIAAGRRHDEIG
ncbi:MAG TPA: HAMP domain-containing protein, partial [Myxococcota bacterium]